MLIKDRSVTIPVSPHALPGTMAEPVLELLAKWGYEINNRPVLTEDLFGADQVLITNSLMGAVPALSLDGKRLSEPSSLWQDINATLL